jgi:hypothetical protein
MIIENMFDSKIIYQINVEDLQKVAGEIINRSLTEDEIDLLESEIGDQIDWYGVIQSAINKNIDE